MADETKPADTKPAKSAVKMARGVVAKGRTVSVQTSQSRIVNYTGDGKPIVRYLEELRKPGQDVELPEDEIIALRLAGFLIDPDAPVLKSDIGPTFERKV